MELQIQFWRIDWQKISSTKPSTSEAGHSISPSRSARRSKCAKASSRTRSAAPGSNPLLVEDKPEESFQRPLLQEERSRYASTECHSDNHDFHFGFLLRASQ